MFGYLLFLLSPCYYYCAYNASNRRVTSYVARSCVTELLHIHIYTKSHSHTPTVLLNLRIPINSSNKLPRNTRTHYGYIINLAYTRVILFRPKPYMERLKKKIRHHKFIIFLLCLSLYWSCIYFFTTQGNLKVYRTWERQK